MAQWYNYGECFSFIVLILKKIRLKRNSSIDVLKLGKRIHLTRVNAMSK